MTATGCLGCFLNLASFYKNIEIDDIQDSSIKRDGFTYIEWGKKNETTICKGFHKKMLVNHKSKTEGKRFDKQASVIIRKYDEEKDSYIYQNVKIFYNGSVQMTGLKSVDQGLWVLDFLLKILKQQKHIDKDIYYDESHFKENALKPHNYNIQLINCDYKLGYFVNRRVLDQLLNNYGIYHVFEAGHYPGVKISFYWNKNKTKQNGVCECVGHKCMTRTKSIHDTEKDIACKKITVIVFQSGSVIITGSQTLEQVNDTYQYMNDIFSSIKDQIKKPIIRPQPLKKYPKFSYSENIDKKKMKMPKGYIYQE